MAMEPILIFVVLLHASMIEAAPSSTNTANVTAAQSVAVRLLDPAGKILPATNVAKVVKTEAEWRTLLTPEQFQITQSKGTERAFCGAFYDHKKAGTYYCVCCDLPLFSSDAKFNSGTGWPSFFQPVAKENVNMHEDKSHGMKRTEILCTRCDSHLGHVFEDGPKPTGMRFCLNSASLIFRESPHSGK